MCRSTRNIPLPTTHTSSLHTTPLPQHMPHHTTKSARARERERVGASTRARTQRPLSTRKGCGFFRLRHGVEFYVSTLSFTNLPDSHAERLGVHFGDETKALAARAPWSASRDFVCLMMASSPRSSFISSHKMSVTKKGLLVDTCEKYGCII